MEGLLAARAAPACWGGVEYRVRWAAAEDGRTYEDSWETRASMTGHAGTRKEMARAERERWVCGTFGEWLERRQREGSAVTKARAKRVQARVVSKGVETWTETWAEFCEYVRERQEREGAETKANVGEESSAQGEEGAGWAERAAAQQQQTCYLGEERQREVAEGEAGKKKEKVQVTSLAPNSPRDRRMPASMRVTLRTLHERGEGRERMRRGRRARDGGSMRRACRRR